MGLATEARKASNEVMPHTLKPDNHEEKSTARNLWITEIYPQAGNGGIVEKRP